MPLYEYECEDGHRFERIQKFSDAPVESCQVCQKPVRKLLSSPAIQFKGSGWYITDYAKKGGNVDSAGSKTAAGDKKAEGSTASESTAEKPAAKPADKPTSAT